MDKKLKKVLNLKEHYNIADSIPLYSISDDGIAEVAQGLYSRTYKVQDINFGIAKREERGSISGKWANVLKAIDPAYDLQVCICNETVDVSYLESSVLLEEVGDGRDNLRNDINGVIRKNLTAGNNGIRRSIYLTLTIPAVDMASASQTFATAEHDIISILRSIPGCNVTPLKALKRLNLLHDIFAGCVESEMAEYGTYNRQRVRSFSLENIYRSGVTAVEMVQPSSMEYKNDHFVLGNKYGRAYNLKKLPTIVRDSFIRDFTSLPYNLVFSVNLHQMDSVTAHNLVKAQRTNAAGSMAEVMKRASQQGYDATLTNPDLANNFNEANALLQDIESRDQKLYESKFHVVIFGDTLKELDNHCTIFLAKCRTRDVEFEVASGLQENAFLSSIPFGIDNTPASRTLTTETLAVCAIPFSCQEMTMRGGICYGKNKVSHNVVSYNRMAGDSYGMLVLGFTGSGKSFFVKKEIANTFLAHGKDADVIIIDPQAEYGKLCRACGGTEINIKSSGEHHINPMDISKDYGDGDPVSDKEDFVQSMMTEILSYTPDATQRSAISIATMRCYDAWKLSGEDKDIPTMETFYRELCNYYNSDGCSLPSVLDLVKAVEYYVCGTATLFQGASNVDINSSFVSYNISELGESIRPLAMLVILDSILNRMSRNRKLNRPTYVYIDEMHLLFRKQQTADFIKKLWKVGRKYKLAQCGITQDVPDLLGNTAGIAVLSNTAMVVLLKQAPINQGVLQEQLNLSERQLEYITDTPPGEGLLYIANSSRFSGGVIPFEDHYPEDSLLYEICQTSSVNEDGE